MMVVLLVSFQAPHKQRSLNKKNERPKRDEVLRLSGTRRREEALAALKHALARQPGLATSEGDAGFSSICLGICFPVLVLKGNYRYWF